MKIENQLLARLVRGLTGAKEEVQAEVPATEVEATVEQAPTETLEAAVEAVTAEVATLELAVDTTSVQAVLAEMTSKFEGIVAAAESALAEMTAKYEGAQAALAALAAEKELAIAAATVARLTARKEKIEAAIGTEKAAGLMAATEGLEDAQFQAVISALTSSVDAEANTELFKEVGVTAEADAGKIVAESAEMRILKQKYGAK